MKLKVMIRKKKQLDDAVKNKYKVHDEYASAYKMYWKKNLFEH